MKKEMKNILWPDDVVLPPKYNMARHGEDHFREQSASISSSIDSVVQDMDLPRGFKAFDFGAGIGRTAIPLYFSRGYPHYCSDVDNKCIEYLRNVFPKEVGLFHVEQEAPLPLDDESVDLVISVSVFTHLPEHLQNFFLNEIRRVLKSGGVALLTTSGLTALKSRKRKGIKGWEEVSENELMLKGHIFKPVHGSSEKNYGYTLHSHQYIRDHWSAFFNVEDILSDYIDNVQDLVVVSKLTK